MAPLKLCSALAVVMFLDVAVALGQPNCNTALSRLARGAAEKAIRENQTKACSGLKQGPIAIDKTKDLELKAFELCEDGPIIRASAAVFIRCATSDAAVIRASASETVKAVAVANLDTCKVTEASVSANGDLAQAVLKLVGADKNMRSEIEKAIKPYCKP